MSRIRVLMVHTELYNGWRVENLNIHICLPLEEAAPDQFDLQHYIFSQRVEHQAQVDLTAEFKRLEAAVKHFNAQVVLISQSWKNFPPQWFSRLKALGARVVIMLWDTPIELTPFELSCLQHADYVLNCESVTNYFTMRLFAEHILKRPYTSVGFAGGFLYAERFFHREVREKSLGTVLLGSVEGARRELVAYLEPALAERGIPFTCLGGIIRSDNLARSDDYLEIHRYVETIWRSDILICSQTQPSRRQLKGKVMEFLACGAFCLVDRNAEYALMLPEGVVAYYDGSHAHLVERIAYYHAHPEERAAIAEAGYQWFQSQLGARGLFWARLLERVVSYEAPPVLTALEEHYRTLNDPSMFLGLFSLATREIFRPLECLPPDPGFVAPTTSPGPTASPAA